MKFTTQKDWGEKKGVQNGKGNEGFWVAFLLKLM